MAAVNLASFQSPGVYVKEVDSGIKAINGVGTGTAGFIGLSSTPPSAAAKLVRTTDTFTGDAAKKSFELAHMPANTDKDSFTVKIEEGGHEQTIQDAAIKKVKDKYTLELAVAPVAGAKITVEYEISSPIPQVSDTLAGTPVLCTNFGEFKKAYPDFFDDNKTTTPANFSGSDEKNYLAHAVYGFFNNGGSRCYVIYADTITNALDELAKIDEISMVAAPGKTDATTQNALISHCTSQDGIYYRVAILDGVNTATTVDTIKLANNSDYAALYYPWIKVADPKDPKKTLDIPPSGHIAGIYARVDNDRGVHKAPANETVRGALGVSLPLSKPQQDGLNPAGINCIRMLNNNILVWGARTLGGDANQDLKYINVRRTLLFLRKSIDQNTQWVVFEPNTPALWYKITRNVTAFLTTVWRSGALFGNSPDEAFYVKCDRETNPPDVREAGAVVTEIGVAIARPAEFVVFRISQWAGPGQ